MQALNFITPVQAEWRPPVLLVSGLEGIGIAELWRQIENHRSAMLKSGGFERRRREQAAAAFRERLSHELANYFQRIPALAARQRELETAVVDGRSTPASATAELLALAGLAMP